MCTKSAVYHNDNNYNNNNNKREIYDGTFAVSAEWCVALFDCLVEGTKKGSWIYVIKNNLMQFSFESENHIFWKKFFHIRK